MREVRDKESRVRNVLPSQGCPAKCTEFSILMLPNGTFMIALAQSITV